MTSMIHNDNDPRHLACRMCLELVLGTKGAFAALRHDLVHATTVHDPVKCCACNKPRTELYQLRCEDRHVICAGARSADECSRVTHARALRGDRRTEATP
jgi:hypothetical protein